MDSELREAIALYQDQLQSVAAVLASEPHNEEALQLQQQLQEALDFTLQALNQAYGQEDGQQQEQQKEGGPGEYQFNSDENLAIAAAAAAGAEHADPHGTGLADTAAAARAQAARTTKNKRAAQGSPGAGENEEEEQELVGSFELPLRGAATNTHSDYSSDTAVAGTAAEASQAAVAEEERRSGHLSAGPSGRQGHALTGLSSGQVDLRGSGVSPSRRSSNSGRDATSIGGQHSRLPGAGRAALSAVPSGRQGRNNARMHPNNRYYREEPDFVALSESHPELRPYLTLPKLPGGRAVFNYASWEGTRQLTSTLLKADFGIDWWLPEGQLVPTVINRANYVHWINDLLGLSSPEPNESGLIEGLDIGCGTNLIYCLLGAAVYGWRMVGVDVTDVALDWAERHIEHNPHLQHLLEVRQPAKPVPAGGSSAAAPGDSEGKASQAEEEGGGSSAPGAVDNAGQYEDDPGGIITPALVDEQETFAFSMCNPPFFESIEEANSNPATACGGSPEEMVYPGGEVAFIMRMMEDSVRLGGRIHWYTTMVGKKTTLKVLRKELHARHVTAIRTTELAQGKTSRWAIAWSFAVDPNLASVPIARPVNPELARPIVPKRSVTFQLKTPTDPRAVLKLIAEVLEAHGASPPPSIDQGLWRVSATVPHAAAAAAAAAPRGPDGAEAGGSVAVAAGGPHRSSSGPAKATKLMGASAAQAGEQPTVGSPPSASAAPIPTAATAGAAASSTSPAEQQHKKPRSAEAPPAEEQGITGNKVPAHGAGAGQGAAAGVAAAAGGPGLTLRVTLFQVQRGMYEVCASVPNSAGLTDATRFTALMQRVQGDIEDRVVQ